MVNVEKIMDGLNKSVSDLAKAVATKEVAKVEVEPGYTPYFDRTYLNLWIVFTDGTEAICPVGWYQGEPEDEATEDYANGSIAWIGEL